MDLQNNGDQCVEDDQDCQHPKADEVQKYPVRTRDVPVHVHCDEPVVDDHLVEERDHRAAKVIKVHQIVEERRARLIELVVRRTSEDKDAQLGIREE